MWKLRLEASDAAVSMLREQVPDSSIGIVLAKDGDVWLMQTNASTAAADAKSALDAGNETIDRLNFAVSLRQPGADPVPHASTVIDKTGAAHHFVEAQSAIAIGGAADATVSTTTAPPTSRPRTHGELILDLADIVPEVDEVARIWANGRDPVDLYRVFEVIRDQGADGSCRIDQLIGKASLSRFTHTMNHPAASGERARHARSSAQPPSNPMSLVEAIRFVSELIDQWLVCLAGLNGIPVDAPIPPS